MLLVPNKPSFAGQNHLPQMVGRVVGSTQENSQSVPGWVFGVVFLGHRMVSLQPFVRGKTGKLREEFSVNFVPIFFQLSPGRELCGCLIGIGDEDGI